MIRILTLFILLIPTLCFSQVYFPNSAYGKKENRTVSFLAMGVPNDTTAIAALPDSIKRKPHIAVKSNVLYLWDTTLYKWSSYAASGGAPSIGEVVAAFGLQNVNDSTLKADSLVLVSWYRLYKVRDSLQALINAKVNISDSATMLANYLRGATEGFGIDISGTQHKTWTVDSFSLATRARVKQVADSLGALIGTPTNIYNTNGTLSGSRTLDGNGNNLVFNDLGNFQAAVTAGTGNSILADDITTTIYAPDQSGYVAANAGTFLDFKFSTNRIRVYSDSASSIKRISYTSNINGSLTAYSLVTKSYVDSLIAAGGGGGIDSLYADTTFHKVSSYTADQKRGNVLGSIYEQNGFANLDDFTVIGGSYSIENNMIVDSIGSSGCSYLCGIKLNYTTMLERWTIASGFKVGDKTSTSYGVQIGITSSNATYIQNLMGRINLRSTAPHNGRLDLVDGQFNNNILSSSSSNISFSVGDSIELILNRNINIFTLIARNVTTGTEEISVSYTYTGFTTAVNTGNPTWAVTGGVDSLYYFKFHSDESKGADLVNIGDSKMTWYGMNITQRIPNLMYQEYGTVISQSGSGNKTAEAVSTLDETISLRPAQALVTVGSNDMRGAVSSATWQANLDTIYNKLTRNGIDVYFSVMYETDEDLSALVSFLNDNYPLNFILDGYTSTRDCASCLGSDNIHLTAYGNRKWLSSVAQSGVIDFLNQNREMTFRAGDSLYVDIGDSLIVNRYFKGSSKLNVFREGELQWLADSYEAGSITRNNDTIFFHPPLSAGERVVIQSYRATKWATIDPEERYLLTDFTSASRAYSLRRLNYNYGGSCVRVRRSSDNAESDIGFLNNFLDTNSMKTFIGSSSGYVSIWYDQSGFDENAVQSSTSLQPRLLNAGWIEKVLNNVGDSVASIKFDGSNDYLQYTGVSNEGVDWTTFLVSKRTSAGQVGGCIGSTGSAAIILQNSDNNIYFVRTVTGVLAYKSAADATANLCLLTGIMSGTLGYLNSSSISFGGESFGANTSTVFNTIGNNNGVYSNGHISEAIIYPNSQVSNRAAIETRINAYYNMY